MNSLKKKIIYLINKAKSFFANFYFRFFKKIKKQKDFSTHQKELDKRLVYLLSKNKIPNLKQVKYLKKVLSKRELFFLRISVLVLIVSLIFLSFQFYKNNVEEVPAEGGSYVEGVLGFPKYINPLYAGTNDVDSDISSLVFSSLFKHDKDGLLVGDLAKEYSISEDGKIYTIKIRQDAKWHNGENLTVDDIVFTFNAIVNSQYKSPLRFSFTGVAIEKVDEETITFALSEPYAAFLELLTFGILPQNLWIQIPAEAANLAEMNIKPIGSGPYKFKSLVKDKKTGTIKSYHLIANEDYYEKQPFIEDFTFKFFINFEEIIAALNDNDIDGIGYLPRSVKSRLISQDSIYFHNLSLPHLTAVFFNEEENEYLDNVNVRKALAVAIDREEIANDIFQQEVEPIYGPILPENFAYNSDLDKNDFNLDLAQDLLIEEGWATTTITEMEFETAQEILSQTEEEGQDDAGEENMEVVNEEETMDEEQAAEISSMGVGTWFYKEDSSPKEYLKINLSTVDNEDNVLVVEAIKNFWENLGVKTNINIVPINQIQSEVIKPRNFEALFYGQVVGSDPDSYVFWHSSQIGENGLNIANYSNKKVDTLLEDARLISDKETRIQKYKEFQEIITNEVGAIFMYSPLYTYVQSKKVKGFATKSILKPADRFSNVSDWYIKTGKKINW